MLQYIRMDPKVEANIFALGLTTIFVMGSVTLIVACFGVLWLAFQLITLIFMSIVECCSTMDALYNGADPIVRLLIIVIVGTVVYRVARKIWRVK